MKQWLRALSPGVAFAITLHVAGAQTWDTNANNRNWGDAQNWSPSVVPNSINATATLGTLINANKTINVNSTFTIGTLVINNANNYDLSGGGFVFDVSAGSAAINVQNAGSPTITSNITMADNLVITESGTGLLTLAGNVSAGANTLTVQGTGNTTISGAISGTGPLIKNGTGTLRLSGNSTFSAPLTINSGVVVAASNNALGASSFNNSIATGASLHLSGGITVNEGSLQIRGTGPSGNGALQSVSGANTLSGIVTASTAATVGASAGASLSLTGSVELANDMTFAGAGNFNISGQVYGPNALIKTGSGTLQFSGASYDITGRRLDVRQGVVELNRAGRQLNTIESPTVGTTAGPAATLRLLTSNQIRDDLFVHVHESGTFDLNNNNEGLAGLRLYGGAVQTGTGTLTITNSGGDEIHAYVSNQTATVSGNVASNLVQGVSLTAENGSQAVDLNISAAISGSAASWTKYGTGTLEFSGGTANTYTGQTIINAGTLRLNKASGVDAISGSSITVNSGGTLLLSQHNQIKNSTNLILNGGTFSTGDTTGFSEKLGTLTLSANSTINLGTGIHLLQFDDSSALAWSGTLTIYGWTGTIGTTGTQGKIFFGSNASGLTALQLAQISFNGFGPGAILLSSGELVPVAIPEAGPVFAAIALAALFAWRERKRFRLPAFIRRTRLE